MFGRVVQGGELRSVSPSQVATYLQCPRKWWFQKVAGKKPPPHPSQELGEKLHSQQENYFLHGINPTHESCLAALELPEVPKRRPELVVEQPRNYNLGLTAAGIPMRGRIDLQVPPEDGTFHFLDWKSCKDWRHIKTPEELARDPQGITYLRFGFQQFPSAQQGKFSHVYIRTRDGRGAKAVTTDPMSRPQVDEVYGLIETVVAEMKVSAGAERPEDVRHKREACDMFGGCPYAQICPVFTRGILSAFDDFDPSTYNMSTTHDTESLTEKLKARAARTKSAPSDQAPMPPSTDESVEPAQPVTEGPAPVTGINPPDAGPASPTTTYEPPQTAMVPGCAVAVDCSATKWLGAFPQVVQLQEVIDVRALLADRLKTRPLPPGTLVLVSSDDLRQAVLDALSPVAELVIAGNR